MKTLLNRFPRCLQFVSITVKYNRRSYSKSQSNESLLETTRLKLLKSFEDSQPYANSLIHERQKISAKVNEFTNENAASKEELFHRLNFLNQVTEIYEEILKKTAELNELQNALAGETDDEMKKLINEDAATLNDQLTSKKIDLVNSLIVDEDENKENVVLELSAGVGGLESRIFCSELFEMYKAYSTAQSWSFNPIKIYTDMTELGEMMRQAHVEVNGQNVFEYFKFESGVHRVQRVPKTEAKGRIHTSTVGVVVAPKPSEIKIELNPKELKIETKTSGGPGGQHANKTESAVRIVHLPTGIMVYNDEERFQIQNRSRALAELKQKLFQKAYEDQLNKRQANRKLQIGSSARSERIRTYNFIQDRITDHRLNENFTGIQRFLSGESLAIMIENLKLEHRIELFYEILDDFNNKNKK